MSMVAASRRGAASAGAAARARAMALYDSDVQASVSARLFVTESTAKERLRTQTGDGKSCRPRRAAREAPPRWQEQIQAIDAFLGSEHVGTIVGSSRFPDHITRFHVLVGGMLSSQTKEHVNAAVLRRLIARGLTVQDMVKIDEQELAQIIQPAAFHNSKAKYIKQTAAILAEHSTDAGVIDIPNTYEGLLALPGVGPKIATLVMSHAWDNTMGIVVDTHVHRIANRLKWVNTWNKASPKSQSPERTRAELEDWLPRELWRTIHRRLVLFGQKTCRSRDPKCRECAIQHLCPSSTAASVLGGD